MSAEALQQISITLIACMVTLVATTAVLKMSLGSGKYVFRDAFTKWQNDAGSKIQAAEKQITALTQRAEKMEQSLSELDTRNKAISEELKTKQQQLAEAQIKLNVATAQLAEIRGWSKKLGSSSAQLLALQPALTSLLTARGGGAANAATREASRRFAEMRKWDETNNTAGGAGDGQSPIDFTGLVEILQSLADLAAR